MDIYLTTDRLLLRRFTEDDADLLFELHNDPEVMRHLNGGRPVPREVITGETLPAFIRSGFFAAIERDTGEFVGWFHLRPARDGDPAEPELGYRLRRASWRRGYATEGSLALIGKAFGELGARRVFARTLTVNHASRAVMERCGLRFVRTDLQDRPHPADGAEHGVVEYEMLRAEWEARTANEP
ncbi:GNAT family N-acetyltransferase [Nonomuraea rhodomycinica]|uniref:GNAT family N-acetyltransferase n=1 Tax=Nonomuraea rhodomycinica TaxID=1712872 RepID=A0A7Y6IJU0_9ACTN|nr:GNAT family N-acetyltransferase [Nonomuraea rhodomycinica]NUW39025.1 GNAT family N-acetyltransferase [Nonomuraea rhodomycinica]